MGSMIILSIEKMEIVWGNNNYFKNMFKFMMTIPSAVAEMERELMSVLHRKAGLPNESEITAA